MFILSKVRDKHCQRGSSNGKNVSIPGSKFFFHISNFCHFRFCYNRKNYFYSTHKLSQYKTTFKHKYLHNLKISMQKPKENSYVDFCAKTVPILYDLADVSHFSMKMGKKAKSAMKIFTFVSILQTMKKLHNHFISFVH